MVLSLDLIALSGGNIAMMAVGALVWKRNPASSSARSFFIATVAFSIWLTFNYLSIQPFSQEVADFMMRMSYTSGVWLMVIAWYFCYQFPHDRRPKLWLRLTAALTFIIGSIFSYSSLNIAGVRVEGSTVFMEPGTFYIVYGILLGGLAAACLVSLWRNYSKSGLLQRNQIRYVAFGVALSSAISITFNVVLVPILGTSWGSVTANVLVILPLVTFLGYALIRHRYTEIHRMLSWLTTYIISLLILTGWLWMAETTLPQIYPDSVTAQRVGLLIAILAALIALQPLVRTVRRRADHIFSVGWYDSQLFLNEMGAMLAGENKLSPLINNSLEAICTRLGVVGGQLVVLHENKHYESAFFGASQPLATSKPNLSKSHQILVADELPANSSLVKDFAHHGWRIGVPLETRGQRVGYLFLGIKRQGDIFTPKDLGVLQILSNQLAVAIVSAQAFDQISAFNTTLQKQVEEATASLRSANEKLQVEDRMKTEFIILTSHNLRTPLSIIKGYISLLEDTKMDANQTKLLGSMKEGLGRLSQFTEDLLAIDALTAGKQLVLEPVKMKDILEPLIKDANDTADSKDLAFVDTIDEVAEETINANSLRLSGAIRNVLDNAFKFTKEGQVSLIAIKRSTIVQITISDSGIGISKDELPNLFTRFHRATSALQYDYDGEGIGLYLASLVIKEHGGSIEAHSKLGKGSQFIITLPLLTK